MAKAALCFSLTQGCFAVRTFWKGMELDQCIIIMSQRKTSQDRILQSNHIFLPSHIFIVAQQKHDISSQHDCVTTGQWPQASVCPCAIAPGYAYFLVTPFQKHFNGMRPLNTSTLNPVLQQDNKYLHLRSTNYYYASLHRNITSSLFRRYANTGAWLNDEFALQK